MSRSVLIWAGVFVLILGVTFYALSSGIMGGAHDNGAEMASAAPRSVDEIVSGFSLDNPESFNSVEELVDLGEPAADELLVMLDDGGRIERWAASYALSRIGFEASAEGKQKILEGLKKAFNDTDDTVRQTSAAAAAGLGEKDGIPILIGYLDDDGSRFLDDNRIAFSAKSIGVLKAYTGMDFGYDASVPLEERADAIAAWDSWWRQNKDTLDWDASAGPYGMYKTQ